MQIDLLPELPLSGGYENITKAVDMIQGTHWPTRLPIPQPLTPRKLRSRS